MTKERSSSHTRRPIDTSLSNSYSSGVSSLSSSNYGVRTIRVFKNGDPYHQGTKLVVNRRYVSDLDHLLNILSEKIDLPYGAKRLFSTNGKLIRHLNDIEDKQDYVASSNHFIPLKYGNTTTTIFHPFRSTSPINMSTPQSRQSRSQTRNEVKTIKKRSQSGLISGSATSERSSKTRTKPPNGTPPRKSTEGKPKKKVVKKKKKTESEVVIPVADEKKEEKKEVVTEEVKKTEEKVVEEPKLATEGNAEVVIPEAKADTPRTIERSPSPTKDEEPSEDEHKDEKSRSPSPSGQSAHSATENEGHSASEKHSGTETDTEKSPPPARKPTPKPNGKEQQKSGKSEESSDKESDD